MTTSTDPVTLDEANLPPGNTKLLAEYRTLLQAARQDADNPQRHLQLGRFYLRIGHRTRAYSALRAAKALQPRALPPYRLLGKMYQEDEDLEAARDTYLQLLGYEPDVAEVHLELGRVYHALDEVPAAVRALADAVRLDPSQADAYELLSELALGAGEHDRALTYLNHLKALRPGSARIYTLTAGAHRLNGDVDRAVLDLKQAMGLAPQDPEVRSQLASLYLDEGLPRQALEVLAPLVEADPPAESALLLASRGHRDVGELDQAEARLARAQEVYPGSAGPDLERARLRQARGDLEGAERFFRQASQKTPGDRRPLVELGRFLVEQERYDKAQALYSELARAAPEDRSVTLELARVEAQRGETAAALAAYAHLLDIDPEHAVARRERARLFLQDGKFDDAVADLDEALRIDPDGSSREADLALIQEHKSFREAFEVHGEVVRSLARGDYEAARQQLEEVLELVPDNPRWIGDLADVCKVQGDLDAAQLHLERLAAIADDDIVATRALADLHYRRGNWDPAAKLYEKLVDHNEDDLHSRLRVLRILRHRLVNRSVSPDSFDALEHAYRENLGEQPNMVRTRLELAHLHLGMGSHIHEAKIWVSAVETHLQALSATVVEESERVLVARARLELARLTEDAEGAEAACEEWVSATPDDPDAAYVHLLSLRAQGKVRAGRSQAQAYARRFPADGRFHHEAFDFLAEELADTPDGERLGRDQLKEVQRRAAADPGSAQAALELGFAHLHLTPANRRLDGLSLASAAFKKAADLDPDTPWPWWGGVHTVVAGVDAARGSEVAHGRAVAAARAAVRRFPRHPYLLYELGRLTLTGPGDALQRQEGRHTLERALVQGPRPFAPAEARLAEDAQSSGDRSAAFHHLLKVFEEPEGLLEDAAALARLRQLGVG